MPEKELPVIDQKQEEKNKTISSEFFSDLKENNNTNSGNKTNIIGNSLEDKLPGENNKGAKEKLVPLFEKIKNNWNEENISDYIMKKINTFSVKKIFGINEQDREVYLLDEVDKYLGSKGIEKNIVVYNNVVQEKQNVVQEKEGNEKINETRKALNAARSSFKTIPDTDKTEIKLEDQDQDTQNTIKQKVTKINENISDPKERIGENEFLNMQLTAKKNKDNPKYQEFVESFEKLDKLSGPVHGETLEAPRYDSIADYTGESGIKAENQLINSNQKINSFVSKDINKGTDTSNDHKEKIITISKYNEKETNDFFDKKDIKLKYLPLLTDLTEDENYKNNFEQDWKLRDGKDWKDIDINFKKNIIQQLTQIDYDTQNTLKQRIFGSAVSGLAGYFDFSTQQKESAAKDFNIENGFDINDNTLSLKGNIKNKELSFYYNFLDGNLATDDYLHLDTVEQKGVITTGQNKKQNLNIQLPSIAQLGDNANNIIKDIDNNISKQTPEEYIQNLEQKLHEGLTANFRGNQEIVKVRIERSMQKNLAAQESLETISSIINPDGANLFPKDKEFSKDTTNPKLFELITLIDNSLESYSIDEIEQFRSNLITFKEKYKNIQPGENNPLKNFLRNAFSKKDNLNPEENQLVKTEKIFDLFNSFKDKVIDLNSFGKFTTQLEKGVPDLDKVGEKTQDLVYGDPEENLKKDLSSIPNIGPKDFTDTNPIS